jgi:hypothetical protein
MSTTDKPPTSVGGGEMTRIRMEFRMIDEVQAMQARLDRLESLVGTAYGANGTVRPALENAAAQQDINQMRVEIQAVANFLRDNDPARA